MHSPPGSQAGRLQLRQRDLGNCDRLAPAGALVSPSRLTRTKVVSMKRFLLLIAALPVALCAQEAPPGGGPGGRGGQGPSFHRVDMRPEYPGAQGSSNVKVMSHIPLPSMANIEIEQELSRPYAYVSAHRNGYQIINLKYPTKASVLYSWNIEN